MAQNIIPEVVFSAERVVEYFLDTFAEELSGFFVIIRNSVHMEAVFSALVQISDFHVFVSVKTPVGCFFARNAEIIAAVLIFVISFYL